MSGTMRAKMKFHTVTFRGDPDNPETSRFYEANAVYDNATEENRRFNKATPYAKLEMTVDNPAAKLVPGKEYYVDFTPCDEADAQAAVAAAALTPDAEALTYTTSGGYLAEAPDAATHHPAADDVPGVEMAQEVGKHAATPTE